MEREYLILSLGIVKGVLVIGMAGWSIRVSSLAMLVASVGGY